MTHLRSDRVTHAKNGNSQNNGGYLVIGIHAAAWLCVCIIWATALRRRYAGLVDRSLHNVNGEKYDRPHSRERARAVFLQEPGLPFF